MLTTKYMQIALMLLALLCFGERGWGSYHGPTFDHGGGSSPEASSSKSSDDEDCESPKIKTKDGCIDPESASIEEFEKIRKEERKDLSEESKKIIAEKFLKLFSDENIDEEIKDKITDFLLDMNSGQTENPAFGIPNLSGTPDTYDPALKLFETNPLNPQKLPNNGISVKPAPTPVYGPPLPPKDPLFSSASYGLNFGAPRSTYDPLTKKWTPYQDTVEGLVDYMQGSSAGAGSASGSGSSSASSGSSSSGGSHSSGSGSSSSSFDSIGSGELPLSSSLSTGASLPTGTSSNSRGISSTPSETGISQPPISGLTPKPTPIAGGSMAPPTATGGHGGGSSVPSASGSSSPVQFNGSNTQTPLMSRPADAPAPSEIQTEKPKSAEEPGKALSATKSPNNPISLSELKNPAGAPQPDTGAKPLGNLASAGTVERYPKTPESPTRSYASNDRFITPEKAASSNSAKEISKPNSEPSSETFLGSNTNNPVGEQKPSPKANKTPVALGAGASGILTEEVAQPSPVSVAESETPKIATKETKEAPISAKDISSEQAPKEGTFSGDLAIKPKITKEVSPIGKGLSEFAKEVEEAEAKNQAVEITAAPLKAGLTSPAKITPRGLASGIPQVPAKQSPAGTFAKVGAQLDAFASRIKSFFSK